MVPIVPMTACTGWGREREKSRSTIGTTKKRAAGLALRKALAPAAETNCEASIEVPRARLQLPEQPGWILLAAVTLQIGSHKARHREREPPTRQLTVGVDRQASM
jgi:hypothetical protein